MITNLAVVRAGGVPSASATAAPYGPSPAFGGTSNSEVALDDEGNKTFVMNEFDLSLQTGARMRASAVGTPSWMEGTVVSYNTNTRELTISADLSSGGSALLSDWTLNLAGQPGSVPESPTFRNLAGRNGGFEIWQRGTNIAIVAATAYTCDGWYLKNAVNQNAHVSRQPGIANGSLFCARVGRDLGFSGTGTMIFAMPLDTDEVVKARGKKLQLFFTVRAGADWSAGAGQLTWAVYFGTAAPAKRASPYPGETTPFSTQTIALSPGGPPMQVVAGPSDVVGTNVTQAEIQFSWDPGNITSGANDWFEIDDVDLRVVEGATVSATFERSDFIMDYQRCLRHFETSYPYGTALGSAGVQGPLVICGAASVPHANLYGNFIFNQRKRVSPSIMIWSYNGVVNRATLGDFSADYPANSAQPGAYGDNYIGIYNGSGVALTTASGMFSLHYAADAGI